jgi:hypothetical protein
LKQAEEEMKKAADELREGKTGESKQNQQNAIEKMDRAIEKMQEAQNDSISEEERRKFQELEERQKDLEKRMEEFNKDPQSADNQQAQQAQQKAREAMQRAQQQLNKQNSPQAQKEQEEAEKQLNDAKKALEEKLAEYVAAKQEQMLVQVEENLKLMKKNQLAVNESTQKLDLEARQKGGNWDMVMRRARNKLYGEQEEVKKTGDDTLEALKGGNYGGFTRNMELIQKLILVVMGQIEQNPPEVGEGTQLDQAEIIEKLDRMLGAVEGERKRLAEARKNNNEANPGQGQPPPTPLVSKLAEMELVYEEQKSLGEKIRNLGEKSKGYSRDELPEYYKRLYERYSSEQSELKKTWDELRKAIGVAE